MVLDSIPVVSTPAETSPAPAGALLLADVGVPVPLANSFSYLVPPELVDRVEPGARVLCDLGRRKVLGVVLSVQRRVPTIDPAKIKPLRAVIDEESVLPPELLSFLVELAQYYFAPIGEVLRLALPAVERGQLRALQRQGELLPGDKLGRGSKVGGREQLFASPTDKVEAPGSLRGQAAAVLARLRANGEESVAVLTRQFKNARNAVRKLETLGLVSTAKRSVELSGPVADAVARDEPPELNEAQAAASSAIIEALNGSGAATRNFLLFGVTGSGKTEVYMHAIERALHQGRGALVLVPEIGLTPQLLGRFRARFGDAVAVVHSALSNADRHAMWKRLRAGELRVAVGARSALFAPVPDLGLVVVDEEHDGSFKQEDGVRYHARDMALLRAHRAGAIAVLGSATPSIESMALVRRGKLGMLELPNRATQAPLPLVETVDLKRMRSGPTGDRLLSLPLFRAIEKTLEAGEQSIIFLNRRGFAPAIVCDGCGVAQTCPHCSVALTYHRSRGGSMRCHYCDYGAKLAERCSECKSGEIILEGLGTEKLERTIAEAFPDACVARLDRDVAGGAKSQRVLDRVRRGEVDILVGTQMVTKGHDLPGVTLVGVVNADAALSMPDFRAAERGFQLLVQVAGRAGRREQRGRVLVQTRDPNHPAIAFACRHDVRGFLDRELSDRKEVCYPPFHRLALLRIDAVDEELARRAAGRLAAFARAAPEAGEVEVLGPAAAPIARLRNRYRFRVMLRAATRAPLRQVLSRLSTELPKLDRQVRAVIDVDPVSML